MKGGSIQEESRYSDREPLLRPAQRNVPEEQKNDIPGFGCRHTLAFMAFLGFVSVYTMRVNLSVALVAMVNSTADPKHKSGSECPNPHANSTDEDSTGEFDWDETTQGNILGAFFYGYIVTQVPGGWVASRYGGKHVYGFGVLCTAVLTLLTPLAARFNLTALIILRVLEGIGEGVTYPAMHTMWGKWAPVLERSKLVAFTYAGSQIGTVIGMPLSGILCDSDILGGWPSVFYLFGALGCIWFVAWTFIIHESPGQHPRISEEERDYIESSIGHKDHHKQPSVPWKEIATSPAVWAINAANLANNWGIYIFLTCLPLFLKNILHFGMKENGFLSALPYAAYWCAAVFSGFSADYFRQKGYMSTKLTRKVFNSIGTLIPAAMILGVGYVGCDHALAVAFLTLCVGISGFTSAGYSVNHLDIAPPFAGILLAITNSFGTIPGFVSPILVGALTNNNQTRAQWQIVFYITSGIYLFGALFYILFAQGDEQPWAATSMTVEVPDPEEKDDDEEEDSMRWRMNEVI